MKDLLLLGLILLIVAFRNRIKPLLTIRNCMLALFFSAIFSFAFQWYTLQHLPVVDCLPYKVGNNIVEKLQVPDNAIPDSTVITFVYEVNNKQVEFTADNFPDDFNDSVYKFIKRYDKVVRKGNAEPEIKDFSLVNMDGNDVTFVLFRDDFYKLFLFAKDEFPKGEWTAKLKAVQETAGGKGYVSYVVSNLTVEALQKRPDYLQNFKPLRCDATAIKTAARANPTLYLIRQGTIIKKWSYADMDKALRFVTTLGY